MRSGNAPSTYDIIDFVSLHTEANQPINWSDLVLLFRSHCSIIVIRTIYRLWRHGIATAQFGNNISNADYFLFLFLFSFLPLSLSHSLFLRCNLWNLSIHWPDQWNNSNRFTINSNLRKEEWNKWITCNWLHWWENLHHFKW